jgi:hypothetical protein
MSQAATRMILTAILICFIACKKDNNNTASSRLTGNWTFNGLHVKTYSSAMDIEAGIMYTTVTTSEYTTTSNGGTVGISGNTMTGTGITYDANMNLFVTDYEGTNITDTFSTTMPFNLPPTNSTSTFEVIGNDSIHYTSSNLLATGGSGLPPVTGSKFSIEGDILTMISNVVRDKVSDTLGVTITQHETATIVTTLQKNN